MTHPALVTLTDASGPAADAYRALRMNLQFASLDSDLTSLVIASPEVNPSKSTVAANLAIVTAQAGSRVILVDADLRRPGVHTLFECPQAPGITTYMLAQDSESVPPLLDSGVENLRLLTCGDLPPNPADILSSNKMAVLLGILKTQADLVIFDAPPVNVAVDAGVLSAQTDGLMLVVRAGHSRKDRVEQAKETLKRFHARVLGAVLTDVSQKASLTAY